MRWISTPVEEAVAALEAAGVRYVIVGGVAVVLHGHLRATGDLGAVKRNAGRPQDLADIAALEALLEDGDG